MPAAEPDWPHVKKTYDDHIRVKLREQQDSRGRPVTKDKKLQAIEYWTLRLLADYGTISSDQPV